MIGDTEHDEHSGPTEDSIVGKYLDVPADAGASGGRDVYEAAGQRVAREREDLDRLEDDIRYGGCFSC